MQINNILVAIIFIFFFILGVVWVFLMSLNYIMTRQVRKLTINQARLKKLEGKNNQDDVFNLDEFNS